MPIIISQIKTGLDEQKDNAVQKALSLLCLNPSHVKKAAIHKTSVDARREICFVHSVYIELDSAKAEQLAVKKNKDARLIERHELSVAKGSEKLDGDIYIAGFGPAGMFCALTLCRFGYKPIVIERGDCVENRINAVDRFWTKGILDTSTNVQFGEGGAGTFSDGKLTTRISDPLCDFVLKSFVKFGAPDEILTKAKPHIGTDNLRKIVRNIRTHIIESGGEVRFLSQLTDISAASGKISSVSVGKNSEKCGALVLAVGHSAKDTFEMLLNRNVTLQPKAFSVGARIEHLQADIDKGLYGKLAGHPSLPVGEYQLSHRVGERGTYTFCMCPGGFVVPSSSEENTIVTNGMSYFNRAGKNANSAVLVSVTPNDFGHEPLSGIKFIHELEAHAYKMGGGNYKAPAMLTSEFISGGSTFTTGKVIPTYSLGVTECDFSKLFPDFVTEMLRDGLNVFGRKVSGFNANDSILTGVETRTSSPVRIPRNDFGICESVDNLYPCGEGAGYAGGIMSAAVDGIRTALKIIERFAPNG